RGRAVCRVGWLWLQQSRARAAFGDSRRRKLRVARLLGRSRRHAHPHAAGSLPWRGYQRPAAAGDKRSRLPAPARRRSALGPLPGPRAGCPGSRVKGVILPALDFNLAPELEAREPPEARGLSRDQVRLLVSYREDDRLLHSTFRDLPCFLEAGDVVVVNSSATRPAALPAIRPGGEAIRLHL